METEESSTIPIDRKSLAPYNLYMRHTCRADCECRIDLNAAAAGLAEASRLLSASIASSPAEMIEVYFAFVRASKAKVDGALGAYRDHLTEVC